MRTQVAPVNKRPYTVQQQWDRHLATRRRKSLAWRLAKFGIVCGVVLVLLALAAVPLSFG